MKNPYQPEWAKILRIKEIGTGIKLYDLQLLGERKTLNFKPGQFVLIGLPGFGEAPFGICNDLAEKKFFQVCIFKIGKLTNQLDKLKVGDKVTVRGPLGQGWPKLPKNKNILIVAGGRGILPLRSLILDKKRENKLQIFYGSRGLETLLFKDEIKDWQKTSQVAVTLDKGKFGWRGYNGAITVLFDKEKIIDNAVAFLCGPPMMFKFALPKLKEYNFKDEDIYLSLERRMHCGIGVCEHCACGSYYVCQDGPVFQYSRIKKIRGII